MSKQEQQMALDLGTDIVDAIHLCRQKFQENNHYSGVSFYITRDFSTKKYWYSMRTFNYDVEWDYFVKLPSVEAAREIVKLGYAKWHWALKKEEI